MDSVVVDGGRVEDPELVKQEVLRHFTKAFSEGWPSRPKLSGSFVPINNAKVVEFLELEFTMEEVWEAVKDCNENKAPGPDGFNMMCIQKCWKVMKSDIFQFMQELYNNNKLVTGLNSSFITLVPKKTSPSGLIDNRPISLVGVVYKILAKVLSKRLKRVLPYVIGEVQISFLGGRNIFDGFMIANEVVDWWKKSKVKGVILKLDFQKAYDSVNWDYLFSMMANLGLGGRWLGWIRTCVTMAKISILVNGSPTEELSPQKGLRQGDPLSLFLFNIAAEGLNVLLERAKDLGLIKGATIGSASLKLSHLQFADDTILFCDAKWEEIVNVKRILRCFEIMSGLKINFHNSVVCGVGISDEIAQVFASKLYCLSKKLPLTYLGLPLGANLRRMKTWQPVVEKVKAKLALWKRRMLSFAGRLTLIKSVLDSLPSYYISLFKLPKGVAKEIDKLRATFLWGSSEIRRKIHLVNWKKVTLSKEQ